MQYRVILQHIDGLMQDCCNSSALAMAFLQSCIKPLIYNETKWHDNFGWFWLHFGYSNEWQLFNRIRGQDIKLLKTFGISHICDLMLEKKKVKFGMK